MSEPTRRASGDRRQQLRFITEHSVERARFADLCGDVFRGQDEVDAAACYGAFGHIRLAGSVEPLRDRRATHFPDTAEGGCSIPS